MWLFYQINRMNYFCNRIQYLRKEWLAVVRSDNEMEATYRECGMEYEPLYRSFAEYVEQNTKKELQMWEMAKELYRRSKCDEPVWYMITVRPDDKKMNDVQQFKKDVEEYVKALPYEEYMYAFEQKGECESDAGKGFHVHILFNTYKINYYISHVLRDIKRLKYNFINYTAPQCIQVDKVNNLKRAIEYINGNKKNAEKSKACEIDIQWRELEQLGSIVRCSRSSPDESI